jgi:hypothetical protein
MKSEANALLKAASHLTQSPGDTISCCAEERAQREELQMPIRRYVDEGVFSSEALSAMGKALEATTETLGLGNDETQRRAVAKFIIRLAQEDNSLDAAALRNRAVAALGGVAYCAPPAGVQPLNPCPTE